MSKRGENIYKRKDGRYEGRYVKDYGVDGKINYGSVYARTYSEAKSKLAQAKSTKKEPTKGASMTVSQWLANWIETDPGIRETTRTVYRSYINNQIVPKIGKIRLNRLTKDTLQNFVMSMTLAPATVRAVFTVLKAALISAEEKGYINNIWSKVRLQKKTKTEVGILSCSEQKRLERVLNDDNDIGILISLYTGLRIGELCALRWSDIDFGRRQLHVNGTQTRSDAGTKVTPPKSRSSVRVIPIPEFLSEKLKNKPRRGEFVLSSGNGSMDVRSYRRHFKKLLDEAQLPDIKFHALRHTFATRALEVGMDFKTLSEILGHSSVAITLDLYVHSLDEYKRNQMSKLGEIYLPSE